MRVNVNTLLVIIADEWAVLHGHYGVLLWSIVTDVQKTGIAFLRRGYIEDFSTCRLVLNSTVQSLLHIPAVL